MKRTQRKDALRNIGRQKVSYLSILIIALMGVTAFLGICYAAAAMKLNGSKAYNGLDFRDIEVVSTHLLSAEDLDALRNTAGVVDVEPLWQTGANAYGNGARESAVVITVTERLNRPNVREGRLPQSASECAIENQLAEKTGLQVGDTMEWLEMTDATGQYYLSPLDLLITGIITSPDHVNRNVPDVPYVLVTRNTFDHEALGGCCMKALVAVEGVTNANRFSGAYNDAVTLVLDRIEALAPTQIALRDEQLKGQAQAQIDENSATLEEAKQELADGRRQLDDGWRKLQEGEQQLLDGEQELQDAKAQLYDSERQLAEAEQQLSEARAQLDDAKAQLDQGGQALSEGERELTFAEIQLENGWNSLEEAKGTVRDAVRGAVETAVGEDTSDWIDWAQPQPPNIYSSNTAANELWLTVDVKVELDKTLSDVAKQAIDTADIPDSVLRTVYDALYADDPDAPAYDPEAIRAYLAQEASAKVDEHTSEFAQLVDGCAQWDDGHDRYIRSANAYYISKRQFDESMAVYQESERQYAEALAAYEDGLAQFNAGKEAYEQGLRDLEAGRAEIAAKRQELEDGEQQYADGLAQYEWGVRMLDEAREQLRTMEPGRWIVLDGRGNASFVQLKASSDNLSSLQMTFSLLFVVIGALVIYATVSKMVDEQRTLVGATKALGFFNREVFAKYLTFGLSATVLGAVLGILLARFGIEKFILSSYNLYFTIDLGRAILVGLPTLIVVGGGVALATAAVTFACHRLVRTPAIQLMQAPVPKGQKKAKGGGKHLLSLYSRLVLLNIRTDIKRVLVTVVSVAGCCALVVIGFTLKYAIDHAVVNQYDGIVHYDGRVRCGYPGDIEAYLKEAGVDHVLLHDGNVTFRIQDMDVGELYVGDIAAIEGMHRLDDWQTGEPLAPTDEGILIQRRLAEKYDLSIGSTFDITLGGTQPATVQVAGIFENYIGRLMVMSPAYFESLFGKEPTYNAFFLRFGDREAEKLLTELKELVGFEDYTPSDEGNTMFRAATSVINIVVILFILMAAVMAGVVLMNLTNIYILQKKRELTVMRINGFTTKEVIAYVTRETVFTTILGILLGLAAGSYVGYRIVRAMEQSFIQLERGVCFPAWGYAAAMTVLFTVIVNVIALRKVKNLKLTDVA